MGEYNFVLDCLSVNVRSQTFSCLLHLSLSSFTSFSYTTMFFGEHLFAAVDDAFGPKLCDC
jgi:hypothetical protein